MQTIKSAVVVVLLMVILYGAFVAMNGQETELPADLENMISENLMTVGPDFSLDPASTAQLAPSDATQPPAASATAVSADSPFAFWPGAATSPSIQAPPQGTEPAAASPESVANTPPLLGPPPTLDVGDDELAVAPPETPAPAPVAETKVEEPAAVEPTVAEATPPAEAAPTTLAPPPAGDPWLTTLQSSVQSVEAPAPQPAPEAVTAAAPSAPQTVDAKEERADFSVNSQSYENAKRLAMDQIDTGKLKDALRTLSVFYDSPELTAEQRADLLDLLDALASEVIYSRRHLVDLPYIVAPDETLEDIAKLHEVPLELLARINGIEDVRDVMPGTKLKVVRGPFRGEVNVTAKEMTMFLDDLYAGRFPVSTGQDPEPREGVFQVVDKQEKRTYYGPGGLQIDGTDPRNPYGGLWLDLGQQLSIHGSPVNPAADTKQLGCISLSPIDAKDIFMMLGRGSQVTIKR